ncbi:MAG: hypothetical protein ACREHG_06405 [Candidatus Saccharimonadales bacterium]
MLKRYIGNISPAKIRIAGQDFGVVETGDAIVVPDELANSVAWPEYNWQDGAPNKVNDNEGDN